MRLFIVRTVLLSSKFNYNPTYICTKIIMKPNFDLNIGKKDRQDQTTTSDLAYFFSNP